MACSSGFILRLYAILPVTLECRFLHEWFASQPLSHSSRTRELTWLGVGRRPFIAESRLRARVNPCRICGEQRGTGTGFPPSSSVFLCQYHSTVALRTHIIWGMNSGLSSETHSHPIDMNINIGTWCGSCIKKAGGKDFSCLCSVFCSMRRNVAVGIYLNKANEVQSWRNALGRFVCFTGVFLLPTSAGNFKLARYFHFPSQVSQNVEHMQWFHNPNYIWWNCILWRRLSAGLLLHMVS
jgi:hypothetical protein